jgi:hypothetical protein
MVLSFHKYWNKNTENELRRMLNAREKYNVPIWIGETGENSNTWYTEAISLFEKNNIGWAWWPLKKAGANNPLEVFANHNWMAVARYLNGEGQAPKESDVYSGMMELAVYAKLENCTFHKDVTDAMFRQTKTTATLPFKKVTVTNHSVINAVDYDLGRNGYAYYDTDTANYGNGSTGNRGHTYRNDGVDIKKDSSHYERYFVSDIADGEWLQYTFNVAVAGNYSIALATSSANNEGNIKLILNDSPIGGNIPVSSAINVKNILLKKGTNKLRVVANKGGFDFRTITFTK